MTESDESQNEIAAQPGDSLVDHVAHAVVMAKTGIPPQVQKNLFKAIGRMIGSGTDVVAALFNTKTRLITARGDAKVSGIKAQQKADNVLIQRRADVAAQAIELDALEDRAKRFRAVSDMLEQENREDVVRLASQQIAEQSKDADAQSEIDTDWLAAFLAEAGKRSSEDFKQTFARVLAGEINSPGSFSIGLLQSLSRLTQKSAETFQKFCNISFDWGDGASLITEPYGLAGDNKLERFGLSYGELTQLIEDGLVRPDFNEGRDLILDPGTFLSLDFTGEKLLVGTVISQGDPVKFRLSGPALTRAGFQLRSVVSMSPPAEFLPGMSKWFLGIDLTLNRIYSAAPGQMRLAPIPPSL